MTNIGLLLHGLSAWSCPRPSRPEGAPFDHPQALVHPGRGEFRALLPIIFQGSAADMFVRQGCLGIRGARAQPSCWADLGGAPGTDLHRTDAQQAALLALCRAQVLRL